jgi:hypothetical protein
MTRRVEGRRALCLGLGALAALAGTVAAERGTFRSRDRTTHAEKRIAHRLRQGLDPLSRLKIFGQAYLGAVPGSPVLAEMLEQILSPDELRSIDELPNDRLFDIVRTRIRADYTSDRLVCVSGWLLSRTEAALCALVALLASGG